MRHHGNGRQLEAVQQRLPVGAGKDRAERGEGKQEQCGRQGKGTECRECTAPTGPQQSDRKAELAARRSRQELAGRQHLRIARFIHPVTALDKLAMEIAQVRDRSAEAGQAKPEKHPKDFERRAGRLIVRASRCGGSRRALQNVHWNPR